jgi:hypothetical protein
MKDDYRHLLQKYAPALFVLEDALNSLNYEPTIMGRPSIHYILGSDIYWYHKAPADATLAIIWGSGEHTQQLTLRSGTTHMTKLPTSNLSAPPQAILSKASQLLRELDNKRTLIELYKRGRFEDDRFLFGEIIPLPDGHQPADEASSGASYTVTRDGTLGLGRPYTDERILYALLGIYSFNSHHKNKEEPL